MVQLKSFDLPRLWFAIYRRVVALNQELAAQQLDRGQLREVTTSIFIASTQRGRAPVWPAANGSFEQSILELLSPVVRREEQEEIYRVLRRLVQDSNGILPAVQESDLKEAPQAHEAG